MHNDQFRAKLIGYLETIVKLDFDWTDDPDEATVYGQEKAEHPGYQFPDYDAPNCSDDIINPDEILSLSNWTRHFQYDAKTIAVATQTHKHTATCRKKGTACRFGFGGEGKAICPTTTVDLESGQILLKRANAIANNHNPLIASVTRSNHDLKLVRVQISTIDVLYDRVCVEIRRRFELRRHYGRRMARARARQNLTHHRRPSEAESSNHPFSVFAAMQPAVLRSTNCGDVPWHWERRDTLYQLEFQ